MKSHSELTFRAVISGLFVGSLIAMSNVCIGLKIGWTFGASITAAVISFALFSTLRGLKRPYTSQENLISATAGSSSGTMASAGGFVSSIPALEMIRLANGQDPLTLWQYMIWAISIAFLGVHFAVPLRRQMVVVEKLRYPTGTAAGETIKAMYASGTEAMKKTKVLVWAAIGAALWKALMEYTPAGVVENMYLETFGITAITLMGFSLQSLYFGLNMSPMMIGAGILIGRKVGWSLLGGAVLAWGIITPMLLDNGRIEVAPDIAAVRKLVTVENGDRDVAIAEAMRRTELLASNYGLRNATPTAIVSAYVQADVIELMHAIADRNVDLAREVLEAAPYGILDQEMLEERLTGLDEKKRVAVTFALARLIRQGVLDGEVEWQSPRFNNPILLDTQQDKDVAVLLLTETGASNETVQTVNMWLDSASYIEPIDHLMWMMQADVARASARAVNGREINWDELVLPYRMAAIMLGTRSVDSTAVQSVGPYAERLVADARASLAQDPPAPLMSLDELKARAMERKAVLRYDLPDTTSPYRAGFNWVLWTGVALMITSSFVSLGFQWKAIARTFKSLKGVAAGQEADEEEDAPDPYPMKYWLVGMTAATVLTAVLAYIYFGIPIWMGILAVILSLFVAAIAVRATGETDINPVGAMGKITQVVFGALHPGYMQTNLMAAGITAAGASQAGDLMHDLKAGHMLKVSIRKQVITQLIGVVVGVLAASATFKVLMLAYDIPGDVFPGPAVYAWFKMAEILGKGFAALPPGAMWGALAGAIFGIIVPVVGKLAPKVGKWLPSPVAFGIAFMVHPVYSIAMWAGAIGFGWYEKRNKEKADKYGFSLASGLIAGEGLMMVVIALIIVYGLFF